MKRRRLLWRSSLRYLERHPWQYALAVLGIALGVAVVLSIDLANASARRAFSVSTETVAGRTTHRVVGGPSGVPEELYVHLRADLGIRAATPVVEGYAVSGTDPDRTLRVLGIDPLADVYFRPRLGTSVPGPDSSSQGDAGDRVAGLLAEPRAVLASADLARSLDAELGEEIVLTTPGARNVVRLVGHLPRPDGATTAILDHLIVTDVATAQELFDRIGALDRIDLVLPRGPERTEWEHRIRAALDPGSRLEPAGASARTTEEMTRAFRLNLTALSLLALICGAFLIYNTISFSVVQRRPLLGTLRALGVTRREIFFTVIGEALLIGLPGTILGLSLGALLGRGLLHLITRTINDLYFVLAVERFVLDSTSLGIAVALGLGATLLAVLHPALEATTAPPRATLVRSRREEGWRRAAPRAAVVGLLLLGAGGTLLAVSRSLTSSFGALFLVILGFALITPGATVLLMRLAGPPLRRLGGLLGSFAARDVVAALSRTAVSLAALMIAVSVIVAVGVMVDSFRTTVDAWLERSLQADLYVTGPGPSRGSGTLGVDDVQLETLGALPGVASVSSVYRTRVETSSGPERLVVFGLGGRSRSQFRFVEGDPRRAWNAFLAEGALLLTEPYAYRHDVGVGSEIELHTDRGPRTFTVAGVYASYVSDRGAVVMHRSTYERHFDDDRVSGVSLYLEPDAPEERVAEGVRRTFGTGHPVRVRSNRALRRDSLRVFDRTFRITEVLRLLVTVVAFVGVLSSLMALQLERVRQVGILRATGLTPRQVRRLVLAETGLMGLAAGLFALPVGTVLAAIMIYVINRRSFGWTLTMEVDPVILLQALAVSLVAALLAGLYPARRMSRAAPAAALRDE